MISLPLFTGGGGNNMAAAAARAVRQVVKPHIPSIKFPARAPGAPKDTVTSGVIPKTPESKASAPQSAPSASSNLFSKKNAGSNTTIDSSELPPKYRRKPLSDEEMEFIEKGGKV